MIRTRSAQSQFKNIIRAGVGTATIAIGSTSLLNALRAEPSILTSKVYGVNEANATIALPPINGEDYVISIKSVGGRPNCEISIMKAVSVKTVSGKSGETWVPFNGSIQDTKALFELAFGNQTSLSDLCLKVELKAESGN